jgi:drug/metabolite transporter (DMT)-like permease
VVERSPLGANTSRRGAVFTLAAAAAAAIYVIALRAARDVPRESFVLALLLIAALANLLWLLLRDEPRRVLARPEPHEWKTAAALALCTAAANFFVARASATLDSGAIAALFQTEIFFVAIAAWLVLRERPSAQVALGAAVATAGVLVARAPGSDTAWDPSGVAWALASAIAFALLLVITRGMAQRIHVERVNAYRLLLAAPLALLLPGALRDLGTLSPTAWALAALAGVAGPVVSRLLQMHAVRDLEAVQVKLGLLTTAIFAYALEAILFGRLPSSVKPAGAAPLLVGVGLSRLRLR